MKDDYFYQINKGETTLYSVTKVTFDNYDIHDHQNKRTNLSLDSRKNSAKTSVALYVCGTDCTMLKY